MTLHSLSDADARAYLNTMFGAASLAPPATWYFALVTTEPTDDTGAGLVEVAGGSYARVAVTNDTTSFPTVTTGRLKVSAVDIQWPTATAAWGTVVGIALFDAAAGGTYRGYYHLPTAVTVAIGGAPKIAAGNFSLAA